MAPDNQLCSGCGTKRVETKDLSVEAHGVVAGDAADPAPANSSTDERFGRLLLAEGDAPSRPCHPESFQN